MRNNPAGRSHRNSVILSGYLLRDPVTEAMPDGRMVCRFTVASYRYYRDGVGKCCAHVNRFDVESPPLLRDAFLVAFGSVQISGYIQQEQWHGTGGESCSRVYIVAEHIEPAPAPFDRV